MANDISTIEHLKAVSDHFKHITTLSSGFILVMMTMIEKVFNSPKYLLLVTVSFITFTLATVFSVVSQAYFVDFIKNPLGYQNDPKASITVFVTLAAWIFFLLGVASLSLFAVLNFQ